MVRNSRSTVPSETQTDEAIPQIPGSSPEYIQNALEGEKSDDHSEAGTAAKEEFVSDVPLDIAREVWESLREEFYEQVEQLPLSLHRSFALISEQDKEAEACQAELLPTIRSYVRLRQTIHVNASETLRTVIDAERQNAIKPNEMVEEVGLDAFDQTQGRYTSAEADVKPSEFKKRSGGTPHKEEILDVIMTDVPLQNSSRHSVNRNCHSSKPAVADPISRDTSSSISSEKSIQFTPIRTHGIRETDATVPKSVPFPPRAKPKTTRELLTRISFLMSELLRASEEKVGLATAAYDSVDRHVRALDVAMREQGAAAALGLREGTRPSGVAVPEENDAGFSEIVEDDEEPQLGMIGPSGDSKGLPAPRLRRNKKKDRRDHRKHIMPGKPPPVRVNLLAPPAHHEMPIDPHEPRYCYCNQVSYGEMIACDNPNCSREWFHLGCAGLTAPPKGKVKWFCKDCASLLGRHRKRRVR